MPGPAPKPAEDRARRNVDAVRAVVAPVARRPPAPSGLSATGAKEWRAFWRSALAGTVCDQDLPALRRLFVLRDEAAEAHATYQDSPLVSGSTGQLVTNPAGRHALALDAAVLALEDRFALNPKSRLATGVRMGQLADVEGRHPGLLSGQEGAARADPRLAHPEPAAADRRPDRGRLDGGESPPR